jgi:hypothetical protein
MGRKKTKMGEKRKKRKFFFVFIFPLLACVCVGYIRFHSIRQTHAQLTHREPGGNKKKTKQPKKCQNKIKKNKKNCGGSSGNLGRKSKSSTKKPDGQSPKTAILFLLSALAQIYELSIHTHKHCRWMCKFQSNPSRKEIKKSNMKLNRLPIYAMDGKISSPKRLFKTGDGPKKSKESSQEEEEEEEEDGRVRKKTLVSFPSGNALSLSQCVPPPFYIYATSRE